MSTPANVVSAIQAKQSSAPPQPAPDQNAAPQAAPAPTDNSSDSDESEAASGGVNIMKKYSNLNSKIADMFDSLGVRRTMTMPHQAKQSMADHLTDIHNVLASRGGLTENFVTATHSKHDPKGGATVAHSSTKLRETVVPKDSDAAKTAIAACRALINKIASVMPAKEGQRTTSPQDLVERAKSQIDLVGKTNGVGMTAFDLGAALIAIPHPLLQTLARLHSSARHSEPHASLVPAAPPIAQPEEE